MTGCTDPRYHRARRDSIELGWCAFCNFSRAVEGRKLCGECYASLRTKQRAYAARKARKPHFTAPPDWPNAPTLWREGPKTIAIPLYEEPVPPPPIDDALVVMDFPGILITVNRAKLRLEKDELLALVKSFLRTVFHKET